MSLDTSQQLDEARQRLRAGDRPAALCILKAILVEDRAHVEAWWLAAQAAASRTEAETALRVVLKLQPDHPHAGQALARLQRLQMQTAGSAPVAAPPVRSTPARHIPAPPPARVTAETRGRRNRVRVLAIVLSLLVMMGSGALFVLNLTGHPLAHQIESSLNAGPLPTATPAYIASGAQLQGIVEAGETRRYYFQGAAGTDMFVGVGFAAVASDATTDGALELIDPAGYRMAVSGRDGAPFEIPSLPGLNVGNVSVLYASLDMTGVWELRLIGREALSSGPFVLLMQCLPEQACSAPAPTWQRPD